MRKEQGSTQIPNQQPRDEAATNSTRVTNEVICHVVQKLDFVTDRLLELQHFCENSRDSDSSAYVEQSHFIIGVCGKLLDDAYSQLNASARKGIFDERPSVITLELGGE